MYGNDQNKIMGAAIGVESGRQFANQARSLDTPDVKAVHQALARLHSAKGDIRMCLESMVQRLDMVMTPLGPEKLSSGSTGGPPVAPACALFTEINAVAAELESTAQAMRSYMQRLEV